MDKMFARRLICLIGVSVAAAQSVLITPSNTTTTPVGPDTSAANIPISLHISSTQAQYTVLPLTGGTANRLPVIEGLPGTLYNANVSNYLLLSSTEIALFSCDQYSGNLQPSDVFLHAINAGAVAIVLYSTQSQYCNITNFVGSYRYAYTMTSARDALSILRLANSPSNAQSLAATIQPAAILASGNSNGSTNGTTPGGGSGASSNSNALGPSPSTAVAMIILYSITGVITALFLAIIITGAVRAHRHPERYGPRSGIGRPRQSRARGLAKAMLDTLPIVRFGEREEHNKPTDVELADSTPGAAEVTRGRDDATARDQITTVPAVASQNEGSHKSQDRKEVAGGENGISAAEVPEPNAAIQEENQGCSICTDDFEVGQDQRVLPCDHRFHPACIDPWLLNVSGTCPLCRIDLRPANPPSLEEHDDEDLAPPLTWENSNRSRRQSMRRSVIFNLIGGTSRPNNMTREQRLVAIRELRQRRRSMSRTVEEESNIRSGLRNVFHIRTRRTGADGSAQEEVDSGALASTSSDSPPAPDGPSTRSS